MTVKPRAAGLSPGDVWKYGAIALLIFFCLLSMLWSTLGAVQEPPALGVVLSTPLATTSARPQTPVHPFPDTTEGIHVFNDQLAVWEMSEAQFAFAAGHYDGTQKVFASDIRRLRSYNPRFVVLNYRLGMGLGYQSTTANCEPSGVWSEVIEGERSVREYPEDPAAEWFFRWEGKPLFFCDWGWYVMDIGNPGWREYWTGEVLRQLQVNGADGIFLDSLFPPNYYGADKFSPVLPVLDASFEEAWSARIEEWIAFGQTGKLADYHLIPNVGVWITGRDVTDYSGADGVMVEGFARWAEGSYFSAQSADWQLQMGRVLQLVNLDKVLLLQQYVVDKENVEDRLFILGSYLLVKGSHTYLNLEYASQPEWFPEYEIPVGAPVGGTPPSISSLWRSDWGLYARPYTQGLVLVNPSDLTRTVTLEKTYYRAIPAGGGIIPANADISTWTVQYAPVTSVTLLPNQGAVLLTQAP